MLVRVRVSPGSSASAFSARLDDGSYKIRLKSPPVDGRANAELKEWLAREFSTHRSRVTIIRGATSRIKTVSIEGSPAFPDWFVG